VQGTVNGNVVNGSTIGLGESYTPSDSVNSDGIPEAPFAQGANRIGIHVTGALTGQINNSGTIAIQGNNSAGILIENTVTGVPTGTSALPQPVIAGGSLTITGDNSYGVRTTTAGHIVGGDLNIAGTITMKGQNSVGVLTQAPIDGALRVYRTISTTGYAITTREAGQILTNIQKTPTDLEQGGSALQVQSDVQQGVFISGPPFGTNAADTVTDADGDGTVDSVQPAASLTTFGSAPVISIAGPTAINIGNFGSGASIVPG